MNYKKIGFFIAAFIGLRGVLFMVIPLMAGASTVRSAASSGLIDISPDMVGLLPLYEVGFIAIGILILFVYVYSCWRIYKHYFKKNDRGKTQNE